MLKKIFFLFTFFLFTSIDLTASENIPRLLIKIPTRSRPKQFFEFLNLYFEKLSKEIPYHFLISCDIDDSTMNNPKVIEILDKFPHLTYTFSRNRSKIEAYNKDIDKYIDQFDILIVTSDDMEPVVDKFDEIIVQEMLTHFPDFDGVLNFSDGRDPKNFNTYPIMGINYYLAFGYVYYPEYKAFYCDNELAEVSRKLKKEKLYYQTLFLHRYPETEKAQSEKLYVKNMKFWQDDERLYKQRKINNFFITYS
ncbi:MAG: hypothetical protein WDZ41_03630 [Candidatus Babeliales bacterium]